MKKILHIVEAFGGGIFTLLVDLTKELVKNFEVVIVYGKRKQTPDNFERYFDKKIKFIEIENFTRSMDLKKDIKALGEIKRIIKEEKPDIIHLHSSKAGVLGRIAISGKKVKMFYNPHGFSFLKQDDSKLKRTIYWLIEKITAMLNRKCTIVGCSYGEYLEAKKLNKNSICINNGIDIKKIDKEIKHLRQHEINYKNLKICTIGRIGYQKNPKLFNEIAKELPDIQFTWIGDGELKNELTSSNINVTGWKTRNKVLEELNNHDVFILTSLWEGLPISLLESMYMKKICIVSDCIGNKDVIENGKNGYIAKNKEEFIKKISEIKNNRAQVDGVTKKGREDVLNKYCNDVMVKQYKEIYLKE